jgi:hypothetical protein
MADPHQEPGPRADPARVDELRQRLRSLGYLDAGVDRFVLGPARDTRGSVAIAAFASMRVGLLAAALLGPAAAVGIATRLPGLVVGPWDAAVVALYLAVLFGVAAAGVSFFASLLVARAPVSLFDARPQIVSRGAGVIVGAACLVYLTLWWHIASIDAAALAPGWTIFVLAIAVAISLLLGHAASITAFAVMVAGRAAVRTRHIERRSAWGLTAAAAIAAFAGAATLLLVTTSERTLEAGPAPHLAVVSPGLRVSLIAIDGFDPAVLESLGPARLPNLSRLLAGGARLNAGAVRDPAREWTTVSTGQPPDVHGVHGLETRRITGLQGAVASGGTGGILSALRGATDLLRLTRPSTASVTDLRTKTVWEVAADAGLRAAVVNWWATWPATQEGVNPPTVISDRATLRLERGGALDGEIAPAGVYHRLRDEWPRIRQEAAQAVAGVVPRDAEPVTREAIQRAAEVDALQVAIAQRLEPPRLDLLAIYLPGLDIAQHALLGAGDSISPSQLAARLEALRDYYVYLDGLLASVASPAEGELVVTVAQPGRIATISHGLIGLSGTAAAPGLENTSARAVDIAPTVLYALGVPASRELAGRPVKDLFAPAFVTRHPVREVDSYGRRSVPAVAREGQPLDREMIERLRSLGYVR